MLPCVYVVPAMASCLLYEHDLGHLQCSFETGKEGSRVQPHRAPPRLLEGHHIFLLMSSRAPGASAVGDGETGLPFRAAHYLSGL